MISMTSDNRDVMTPLQVVFHSRGVTVVLQVMVRELRHATTESSSDTGGPTSIDSSIVSRHSTTTRSRL